MHTRSSLAASALLLAALGCRGDAGSPTESGPDPQTDMTAAGALTFSQVSAGSYHTCGVVTTGAAYCWGWNSHGQLGDGRFSYAGRSRPVLVMGGLRFRSISAGYQHTCGVTTDYRAYCWGYNENGRAGTPGASPRVPTAVSGGLRFRTVVAGTHHTCGRTYPDNRAFCWGLNRYGQLGDGTTTTRETPKAVAGGLAFREVSAGEEHTCGITAAGEAYCWGYNGSGQLGVGTAVARRLRPTPVAGKLQFNQVDTGSWHTCAVTIGYRAYCWGEGWWGALGTGERTVSYSPQQVIGGHSFRRVSGGLFHTCGETTDDRAYCWGGNDSGQLGIGSDTGPQACPTDFGGPLYCSTRPVAVRGGLYVAQLTVGWIHTCGHTPDDVGYCWGYNGYGELGEGTRTNRLTPTAVLGPL